MAAIMVGNPAAHVLAVHLVLYYLSSTITTTTFMNTNNFSAFGTSPFYFFISNKFLYTKFFNELKIFNHAHIVFGPISYI